MNERRQWELKNESNKINVRWLLTLLVAGYLSYILYTDQGNEVGTTHLFSWAYIVLLVGIMAVLNLAFGIYVRRARKGRGTLSPALKYITMVVDFLAVSALLVPTGGDESLFFILYFIVIVSNSLRYGMRLAIVGLIVFNLSYAAVLALQYYPDLSLPHLQRELLKVVGFWIVGLYTGYISRRFEILQGEVEKYQRLVERLMQERGPAA
ncbi:MAG: hypothetical protein H7A21_10955 [Spirochaetales bacterium]|nr:hypothetical protein [Leptospiraceae bacterium]MCP5481943.1 hypothetical protein [Spirochaetales bacterium]